MATKPSSVLITDRTITDLSKKTSKAFNNFSDVQRVQDWINYFIDENQIDLPKYTWTPYERVDKSKWETYVLKNITELLKNYPDLSFTVPSAESWDWRKQNMIENILFAMSKEEPVIVKSFSDDSWKTIIEIANKKIAQNYYSVGDTKQESLQNGDIAVYKIVAFNEFAINGTSQKANMMIDMEIQNKTYQMDTDEEAHADNNWSNCTFRTEIIPTILSNLSPDLRNEIKEILINTPSATVASSNQVETVDKLFLYSKDENEKFTNARSTGQEFWRRNWSKTTISAAPPYRYALSFLKDKVGGAWRNETAGKEKKCPLIFNL